MSYWLALLYRAGGANRCNRRVGRFQPAASAARQDLLNAFSVYRRCWHDQWQPTLAFVAGDRVSISVTMATGDVVICPHRW